MFDSLKYAKKLVETGVPREQAEAHIEIIVELMDTNLANKQDIKDVRQDMAGAVSELRQEIKDARVELGQDIKDVRTQMQQEIKDLRAEMTQEFQSVRAEMTQEFQSVRADMLQLEQRMTIKLGGIVSLAVGVAVGLSKIL
ncbi:MAG TPA: DUF1640 domain-containing protein [Bdellovibrionales bacterium]|nr:DUF1640 domain-containing protein [Bdellovibrionales bacterium]